MTSHTITLTDHDARSTLAALLDAHISAINVRYQDPDGYRLAICRSAYTPAIEALVHAIDDPGTGMRLAALPIIEAIEARQQEGLPVFNSLMRETFGR
jgi:hypothetical protein